MHIINKALLWLVLLPAGLWERMGVDMDQLRAILQAKLLTDDRRPNVFRQMRMGKKKPNTRSLALMLLSLVLGLVYLYVFAMEAENLVRLTVYFSMFIVFLAITLIADFTHVLIDVSDNYVILPRPVNDVTLVVSRILHILIHISKIIMPMMLPAAIFLAFAQGALGSLFFIILIGLSAIFTIFIINAVYLFIIRVTTAERFREIITYVQIFFSILIFGAYYVLPHIIDIRAAANIHLAGKKAFLSIPSFWFAGAWSYIVEGNHSNTLLVALIFTFVMPFLCLWVVINFFAPAFNRKLALISGGASLKPAPEKIPSAKKWVARMARLKCKNELEQAAFIFCWTVTGRSRDFKLKVYPSYAYVVVYFIFILLNKKGTVSGVLREMGNTRGMMITLMYISSFAATTALTQLVFSYRFKAAWIYFSSPLAAPGDILSGSLKALIIKFFLPFYFLVTAFCMLVGGPAMIPDLLLGGTNVVLIIIIESFFFLRKFPFSAQQNAQDRAGNFLRAFLIMLVPISLGVLHYFISPWPWAVMIFLLVSFLGIALGLRAVNRTGWQKIKSSYT